MSLLTEILLPPLREIIDQYWLSKSTFISLWGSDLVTFLRCGTILSDHKQGQHGETEGQSSVHLVDHSGFEEQGPAPGAKGKNGNLQKQESRHGKPPNDA